jgi:hypothetical protein
MWHDRHDLSRKFMVMSGFILSFAVILAAIAK